MPVRIVPLSVALRILVPSLLVSSIPKNAIGFSFPRGREGKTVGGALLVATVALSFLVSSRIGVLAFPLMFWLTGGSALIMMFNLSGSGLAFVKELCLPCRLLPLIAEHEYIHLSGESAEQKVWQQAKQKHSYYSLGLDDPEICSFCPIAQKFREA